MRDRALFEMEIARLQPHAFEGEDPGDAQGEVGETVVPGTTAYLPIALSAAIPKKVGAFVPPAAAAAGTVDVIVYFHGHAIADCKTNTAAFKKDGMQFYWNSPRFTCLRSDLHASGRNAILLAPTMDAFVGRNLGAKGYGSLDEDGKFDQLVNEAMSMLKSRGALASAAKVGNIVLAGHSGGGQPMQVILHANNQLRPKIRACWGFESLYFDLCHLHAWLKRDPRVIFRHFRRKDWKEARVKLLEVHPNFRDTATASGHCESVQEFWRKAIDQMPSVPGTQQDYELRYEQPKPVASGNAGYTLTTASLLTTPIKIVNEGSEKAWKAYAAALAKDPKTTKKKPRFAQVQLAPAQSLPDMVRSAQALARKAGRTDLVPLLDPDRWFDQFTQTTFLGRSFKSGQYVHVELAKLLKIIEKDLMATVGESSAKKAGDILLNGADEGISGSRKESSTAAVSMHLFGLAVDVNYLGNPYIETQSDMQVLSVVLRRASALLRKQQVTYAREIKRKGKDSLFERVALDYDAIAEVDRLLEEYFALLDQPTELRARLATAATIEAWKNQSEADARARIQKDFESLSSVLSRGDTVVRRKPRLYTRRDHFKTHAILDFDKRFVEGMVAGGLHWGASYGDMMHFDMRRKDVGLYIEKARVAFIGKAKTQLRKRLADQDYGYHAFEG